MSATLSAPPKTETPPRAPSGRAGALWWIMAVLAAPIVLYGLAYVVLGDRVYPPNLAESFRARPWGIYTHALFGSTALVTGTLQFHRGLLRRRRALHRTIGKVYVVSSLLVGAAGLYMSRYAAEGPGTHWGFGLLGVLLIGTTAAAYVSIRRGRIALHREWMIRSFALIFAAVTLRIELPLLIGYFQGDFAPAYRIIAWLSWVPNLLWAEACIHLTRRPETELLRDIRGA
jgi:uncharacterized membrane protein